MTDLEYCLKSLTVEASSCGTYIVSKEMGAFSLDILGAGLADDFDEAALAVGSARAGDAGLSLGVVAIQLIQMGLHFMSI